MVKRDRSSHQATLLHPGPGGASPRAKGGHEDSRMRSGQFTEERVEAMQESPGSARHLKGGASAGERHQSRPNAPQSRLLSQDGARAEDAYRSFGLLPTSARAATTPHTRRVRGAGPLCPKAVSYTQFPPPTRLSAFTYNRVVDAIIDE